MNGWTVDCVLRLSRVFQSLRVNVVEARGLMARDRFLGRSDPYVNLDLSGRYVEHHGTW